LTCHSFLDLFLSSTTITMAAQPSFSRDVLYALIVWQFLIPLAAGWVQTIAYGLFIRAGDPKPQPGSARYNNHRRLILMAVYAAYFLFTVYELDWNLQREGNAYADLGVPLDVMDGGLQSRFRKLTVRFHPDKVGPGTDRDAANDYYIRLKHARDIILDPAKRFAYDRFGPAMLDECQSCITVRDFTQQALLGVLYTYGPILLVLLAANTLGFFKDGAYWRYLAILALATYEVRTALRPDHPPFLTKYLNPFFESLRLRPPYLPFQATSLLRNAALSLGQLLGLIMPLYRADPQKPASATDDSNEARHKQLDRLTTSVIEVNEHTSRLLELESMPYRGNERAKHELREAMKKYMVQNVVHQERDVRNAIGVSMRKRREGVPMGAKGTR
jgi:hypothetical protein